MSEKWIAANEDRPPLTIVGEDLPEQVGEAENAQPPHPLQADIEGMVLASHRPFIRAFRRLMIFAMSVPFLFLGTALSAEAFLGAIGDPNVPMAGFVIGAAVMASLTAYLAIWLLTERTVERRFSTIRRHAIVAARSIDVDDLAEASDAVRVMMQTWTAQIILFRWLRDTRSDHVVIAGLVAALLTAGHSFAPGWVTIDPVLASGFLVAAWLNVAVMFALQTQMKRQAECHHMHDPAPVFEHRILGLIEEVKDLRRGVRAVA